MKAALYRRYGGTEVTELADLPDPKLSQNSVLVRIRAAALNPADLQLQAGLGDGHTDAWFPVIPGWDMAGVVERTGPGVTEYRPGDEVMGYVRQEVLHHGTYAELMATPVETLVRKPSSLSWEEAAGLPLAGLTAHRAIAALDLESGATVVIHGAAGGVGSLATQLAAAQGATVLGTASPGNHPFLRGIGAVPLAYGEGLADQLKRIAPLGVDAALDCAGKDALATAAAAMKPGARIVSIATGGDGISTIFARQDTEVLEALAAMAASGRLKVAISAIFPLDRVREAQEHLRVSRAPGKVILVM